MLRQMRRLFFLLPLVVQLGCSTLPNGQKWGADATIWPGMERICDSAVSAATDPKTWIPAAGALLFTIDDFDEKVSDWAVRENPVFGSQARAADLNKSFDDVLTVAQYATIATTASGNEPGPWAVAKAKGLVVELAARRATLETTLALKDWTGRTRPDGSDDKSFPSGDASRAFSRATLISKNLDYTPISDGTRKLGQITAYTLAAGEAWSRVEQQKHYPSDVLAGAALGNFIVAFIYNAFIGIEDENGVVVSVSPMEESSTEDEPGRVWIEFTRRY